MYAVFQSYLDVAALPALSYRGTDMNTLKWAGTVPHTCYLSTVYCQVSPACPTSKFTVSSKFQTTKPLAKTAAHPPTIGLAGTPSFTETAPASNSKEFSLSNPIPPTRVIDASAKLNPSADLPKSAPIAPSEAPAPSKAFAGSGPIAPATKIVDASKGFDETGLGSPSAPFSESDLLPDSNPLEATPLFNGSSAFSPSKPFFPTVPFAASETLARRAGGGNSAAAAGLGPLSLPMLGGIAGGIVALVVLMIVALVKCRGRQRSADSGLNEIEGIDLLETEVALGADVTGDTMYYVTEANVLNDDDVNAGEGGSDDDDLA
jgi:hypothetical protein